MALSELTAVRFEICDLTLEIGDEHRREVSSEAVANHDAQHGHVLDVGRHAVRRHEPTAHAEPIGDVVDRVVLDVVAQPHREHGELAAVDTSSNGPSRANSAASHIAVSRQACCTSR